MDCCICTSNNMYRPPRNTICSSCFEGAKSLQTILNMQGINTTGLDNFDDSRFKQNSAKTMLNVWRSVTAMKECIEELNEKIQFLSGLGSAFRDQIHTDIILKPGNDDPPIPAHKALMAVRSEVFKNMLESDTCKAAASDSVMLPEMSGAEISTLLSFLYFGSIPKDTMSRHVYALSTAADKYDIPFLRRACERNMAASLCATSALDILEISDLCSLATLKDAALKFVVRNMHEIAFLPEFDAFALKNPHLCVQITRASLKESVVKRSLVKYGDGEDNLINGIKS